MRRALFVCAALAVVAVASLALVSWAVVGGSPTVIENTIPAASAAPLQPGTESDCTGPEDLALLDSIEAGPQQACCLDQCHTDLDCFFRCGGQPGQCVMNNPCCTECACLASSIKVAS